MTDPRSLPILGNCEQCKRPITPATEAYCREGWCDQCAQNDVWANTQSGRAALREGLL